MDCSRRQRRAIEVIISGNNITEDAFTLHPTEFTVFALVSDRWKR